MYQFRVSCSTISIFVPEVCEVIYQEFADEFMKFPQSEEDWLIFAGHMKKSGSFQTVSVQLMENTLPYFTLKSVGQHTTTIKVFIALYLWH